MHVKTLSVVAAVLACLSCTPLLAQTQVNPQGARAQGVADGDTALLESRQADPFRYFVEQSSPRTGMTRDRSTADSPASVAAVGFALSAYPVGVKRGYVTRD